MRQQNIRIDEHLKNVRNFHDRDAAKYQRERYHSNSCEGLAYLTRKEIILGMTSVLPSRILDVGCGPGILTRGLMDRGHTVISADLSQEMIEKAREAAPAGPANRSSHFVVSDASEIPFAGNCMDMVLSIGLMCYVSDHKKVLDEIHRVLRPGGCAIIQINNIRWPIVYRMFVPLYHRLKSMISGKKYDDMNFRFNFTSRDKFIRAVALSRFNVLSLEHYDFRIPFVDILLPKLSVGIGQKMFEKRRNPFFRRFSHGLLIKVQK